MFLLVGLGNPGSKYAENRHNIGFMALDQIVRRHSFSNWRNRFQSLAAEGQLGSKRVLALKPSTFMNESGRAVEEAARFYKLRTENIIVMHDELDLDFGKIRLKQGGGLAGHNGLRSIKKCLSENFTRVRIGIGHPGDKKLVYRYVLSNFPKSEATGLEILIDAISDSAVLLVDPKDHNAFMTKVARTVNPCPQNPASSRVNIESKNGI